MFLLVWEQLRGSSVDVKHICVLGFLLPVLCAVIHIPHCNLQFLNLRHKRLELEAFDPCSFQLLYQMCLHWSSLLTLDKCGSSHCSSRHDTLSMLLYLIICFFVTELQLVRQKCSSAVLLQFSSRRFHIFLAVLERIKSKKKSPKVKAGQLPLLSELPVALSWPNRESVALQKKENSLSFLLILETPVPRLWQVFYWAGKPATIRRKREMLVWTQGVSIAVSQLIDH